MDAKSPDTTVGAFLLGAEDMPGYRDTLNLPRTEFPMKADLPKREPERLAWWSERDLYRKLVAAGAVVGPDLGGGVLGGHAGA